MAQLAPIYTPDNCRFAYQLRWGVTIHWLQPISESVWLDALKLALEKDEIRILSWRWRNEQSTQFALSTLPTASPQFIAQRLKGRLHYAVRDVIPKALQPHFAIRSFGTQQREVIEAFIAKQPTKHRMAAERTQEIFEELVFVDSRVDLSQERNTKHASYWYNLHLVFVHEGRWRDVDADRLKCTQSVVLRCATKRGGRVSRCSILADHLHVSLGCELDCVPEEIALAMMNNIAWVYGMKPVLPYSAFVGTFGEYDQRSVKGDRFDST